MTESFSLQALQYRALLVGISENILINHQLQLVAEQGWLRIGTESDLQAYLFCALCTQGAHVSMAARFLF